MNPNAIAINVIDVGNTATTYYPVFVGSTGIQQLYIDTATTPFNYIPSTGALSINSIVPGSSNTLIIGATSVPTSYIGQNLYTSKTLTGASTLLVTDPPYIILPTTGVTINLPTNPNQGTRFIFRKQNNSTSITISNNGGSQINLNTGSNSSTYAMANSVICSELVYINSNWFVMDRM